MKKLLSLLILFSSLTFLGQTYELKSEGNYLQLSKISDNSIQFDIPSVTTTFYVKQGRVFFVHTDSDRQYEGYYLGYEPSDIRNATTLEVFTENSIRTYLKEKTGGLGRVNLADTELGLDVWGVPKFSKDISVFSGMFTYNIPVSKWYETINSTVSTTFTNCSSIDGELVVIAGSTLNDTTLLRSFRNPRYEPNRGHLYSTAAFIDNPSADMERNFGLGTKENGVFFRIVSDTLKGVVRTTVSGVTSEKEIILNKNGIDLEKGNLFDLRYQWRGVGNYFFYLNKSLVGAFDNLGKLDNLSMSNPALPAFFESINKGDNDTMRFGCLDITTENGKDDGKTYGSISIDNQSGQVAISGYNVPILVVRVKPTYEGKINTRDVLAMVLSSYSDQRSFVRAWHTRDSTAITLNDQSWRDYGDGNMEFIQYDNPDVTTPITFDTAKANLLYGCRSDQDITFETRGLYDKRTEIYQTPGDILIFTSHRENGGTANVGVTYQFAEQI